MRDERPTGSDRDTLEAIRQSEEQFRIIADSVPQLVWTAHADGRVDYYNSRVRDYGGATRQPDGGWTWQPLVHPDDLAKTQQVWDAAVRGEREYVCEHRVRMADGTFRWHLSRARPIRDARTGVIKWFGTATDIDDAKRAQEQLRQTNAILSAINETTPVLVALKDRDSRIVFANPAVIAVIGRPEAEIYGSNDIAWFGPNVGGAIIENDRRVITTGVSVTVEERTPGGNIWLSTKTPWRAENGDILGVIVVSHDITERKRIEARLQESETILASALEESRRAVTIRDQFMALVSHDLRNPLSVIATQVHLARRQLETNALDKHLVTSGLARIERAVFKIDRLIRELLDVARLQSGQELTLEREAVDLVKLADRVVEEHQRAAPRHTIRVHRTAPSLRGHWDGNRLERVLDNLLSNAIKYSPRGGNVDLHLEASADETSAVIRVIDEGVGIPEADRPHVFQWFKRAKNVAGSIRGTGIGLAGARHAVEGHGGSITVDSIEGKGATFTVRLPRR